MTTTRTRIRRPAAGTTPARPAEPGRCWCPAGPTTVARWVDSTLVTVEHRHLLACGMPSTWTAPRDYAPIIRSVRAPRGGWR